MKKTNIMEKTQIEVKLQIELSGNREAKKHFSTLNHLIRA